MEPYVVLALAAAGAALWGSIAGMRMGAELERRGHKVAWPLARIAMIGWVGRYREMTTAATGHPGPLFRQFVVAMPLALVLAVGALLARTLR